MNQMTDGHTVTSYNDELNQLNRYVMDMAALVRKQLAESIRTLEDEDVEAAKEVVRRDQEVDAIELEADDRIVHIIAKRQPVARDLREIMAVGKIVTDLERIGDQARRIARLTLYFYEKDNSPPNYRLLSDIPKLAQLVDGMLETAILAFDRLDAGLALDVMRKDAALADEMIGAQRRLSTYLMEDARSIGHVVDITLGLRALERIGGHSKYIARHTIYLINGKDVRHEP
ncbi:MAG TPA: phosphate signaling complex protein PhoU, partial [Gammaproteobacteria bacterium]|nr:phosphate signaling complex protein PhoU [Gammaproteobacteria bacterium]